VKSYPKKLFCGMLISVALVSCKTRPVDNARENLAAVLRDSLGAATNPEVAFRKDSTHLLVQFDTVAFPDLSDSAYAKRAEEIGRFVERHYESGGSIDSVTVMAHQLLSPGAWKIRQERTFAAAALR